MLQFMSDFHTCERASVWMCALFTLHDDYTVEFTYLNPFMSGYKLRLLNSESVYRSHTSTHNRRIFDLTPLNLKSNPFIVEIVEQLHRNLRFSGGSDSTFLDSRQHIEIMFNENDLHLIESKI